MMTNAQATRWSTF